jgi:hypothetical protein
VHNPSDSNRVFLQSKGHWHLPISHFTKLVTDEQRERLFYGDFSPDITFCTDSSTCIVHAVYGGSVQYIFEVADSYAVMVRYGSYFITYTGLNIPEIRKGELIEEGQVIGTLYRDSNTRDGELEIILSDISGRRYDPEKWFDWKSMDRKRPFCDENQIVDSIIAKLLQLPEVRKSNNFVDSFTHHKHGVSALVMSKPSKNSKYYCIAVGYNGDLRFETYYNFYVWPKTMTIKYLDTYSGEILTLAKWRRIRKSGDVIQ